MAHPYEHGKGHIKKEMWEWNKSYTLTFLLKFKNIFCMNKSLLGASFRSNLKKILMSFVVDVM